ncbi:MAG: TRAP transporter small permease [Rhodanobacteraceae bacterium]|jgi:TRAP-type C4-dicarboxylate transport system permease small subunit|nr:TRAP transporter small permease [Rhodanobacteraceae bacterium]
MSERGRGLLRWLDRLETGLIALLVLAMVLLAGAQIVLRNLFETGLAWADPLLRAMVLWAAMLGALAAARDDKHIGIDFVTHFVHGRARRVLRAVTLLFAAAMAATVAWYGVGLVELDYGSGAATAGIPNWCIEAIIPVGFALLALRLALRAFLPPRNALPALAPELP